MRRKANRHVALATGAFVLIMGLVAAGQSLGSGSYDAHGPLIIGDVYDPFRYDGVGVRPLSGSATLLVDASVEAGILTAELETTEASGPLLIGEGIELEGGIRLVMERFFGPEEYMQGGIAESLLIHGDTGLMSATMPEMLAELAGWGYVDIYVDGELRYESLLGHFMITERVRRDASYGYQIFRESDGMVYSTELKDKAGFVYSEEKELHLWVANSLPGFPSASSEELFLHLDMLITQPVEFGSQAPPPGEPDPEEPEGPDPETPDEPEKPDKQKGNNGIGNGLDPQPPGNPPVNDDEDSVQGKGNGKPK